MADGPRFITTTSHVAVDLEENAKLKCEAEGNPQPSIIWRKKGSHHILGSGSTLELRQVREADLGTYYCTATVVGFNEISRDVFLLKNGKSVFFSILFTYLLSLLTHKVPHLKILYS